MSIVKRIATRLTQRHLSKLDGLYQHHTGEECYLFGDGVSLKWMDLQQFADRTSIIGNMLIYHRNVTALRAPYCVITEPYWFWPIFPYRGTGKLQFLRHVVHREYRKSIRQHPDMLFFLNFSNLPVARFKNAIYVSRWYQSPFHKKNPFHERTDSHHGTLKYQLSLAVYLGFTKAYLVGHDYTHLPSHDLHFYEKGEGLLGDHPGFCADFIDYAKQYIDLTTITLDGTSETMRAVTYQEFTGKRPAFRENTEIIDEVKLKGLATWHGYSIF